MTTKIFSAFASRRSRAILAGGVVLGIGASATLAAYSDSEWASGTFSASPVANLTLEGSPDGSAWSSDVTMNATLDAAKMLIGQTYYSPLYLRTTGTTNVDANVKVSLPDLEGSTELADGVSVNIVKPTNNECSFNTLGDSIGGGMKLGATATPAEDSIIISHGSDGDPSAASMICFQYTLNSRPSDLIPHNVSATWPVTATQPA